MTDAVIRIPPDAGGKAIDNTYFVRNGVDVYRQRVETYAGNPVGTDLAGRARSSQLLTLFDGKIMNAEDAFKWDTKGTGTATYTSNAVNLSVTAGQYVIRQARLFTPYFSGKPQQVEATHQNFVNQAGVVKRVGYFSSSAVAPYDSDKDGAWLEADGTTYRLITSNNGTETHNIPLAGWDNAAAVAGYDWSKFSVNEIDFLWLGGAGLRLWLVIDGAFTLLHTIDDHAGYADTLIFNSPNQPVRYEIRSTTGSGSLLSICSQVSTEGAGSNEQGQGVAIYTPSISCNVIGTIYALCGFRKAAALRDHYCMVSEFGAAQVATTATPEAGILMLLHNPTLSAPLTWSANSRVQQGIAAAGQTVSSRGRLLKAVPMSGANIFAQAPSAALRVLGVGIDNTMSELIVAYTPLTTNQAVSGTMQVLEY